MSRQGTPAAAGRRNLFQAERGAEAAPGPEDGIRTAGEEEEVADVPDAMELEHVIGFTGSFPSTALYHPRLGSKVIYAMGSVVMIQDVGDSHDQQFLRGHDAEVCSIAVSSGGELIASGQVASVEHPGDDAPVIVWDATERRSVHVLEGLHERVLALGFSPDARFLAASGNLGAFIVWDMQAGEVVASQRMEQRVTTITWGPIDGRGRRPKYTVCVTSGSTVVVGTLEYELRALQYVLSTQPCQMPTTGLYRDYTTSAMDAGQEFLLTGTASGEVCAYFLASRLFRGAVPVAANGVHGLCTVPSQGVTLVGGGDGVLRKIQGRDSEWVIRGEAQLQGCVQSISARADGEEVVVGTSTGKLYRVRVADLAVQPLMDSHVAGVCAAAFGTRSDVVASASSDGSVRVWDLSDYRVVLTVRAAAGSRSGGATALAFTSDNVLLSGWADCALRGHDAGTGRELFAVPNAHHGGITTIAATESFIVTGGRDALVRVWTRQGRTEVVMEFAEHRKAVTQIAVDLQQPHIVHSCGEDHTLLTYNLKRNKRTRMKMIKDGSFTALAQRHDSEQELLTACADGRILCWDRDYDEPVMPVLDAEHTRINSMSLSPTGRFLVVACGDHQIKVFHLQAARVVAIGYGHSAPVLSVRWSPDEKQIVSTSSDCSIGVWNFYGLE